jgi:hypothetical protein
VIRLALHPRLLTYGHAGLTDIYTSETFAELLTALRALNGILRAGIANGRALVEILHFNYLYLPQVRY